MARAALFLTDLFGTACTIVDHSGYNQALPVGNVSTPLPGEVFEQLEGQFFSGAAGMFEVSASTQQTIQINEGAGFLTTTVPDGVYDAVSFAAAIQTALNTGPLAATDYSVGYGYASDRKFIVSASGAFIIRNSVANVLTSECGYTFGADTGNATIHKAESARSSTVTRVKFDAGAGSVVDPDFAWCLLNSTGGADTAASAMYNDCTIYAHATNLGNTQGAWAAGASETFNVSDRPSETENTIQGAVVSTDTGYRFWAFFWHHADDHTSHQIGVLRGAAALSSSTRTVREVGDHQLANRTGARTLENQHPVALLSEWRMAVELERWEASEYRALKVAADRYGAADGMVFALNWTDIVAATLTINGEADKGLVFYGSILDSSSDGYSGAESDYMSGSMRFGQLRGPGAT